MGFNRSNEDLKHLVHPYQFAIQSDPDFEEDQLNYSLMMVHVGSPETIRSPHSFGSRSSSLLSEIPLATSITNVARLT